MEKAQLPNDLAMEPNEEAHQPIPKKPTFSKKAKNRITFADTTDKDTGSQSTIDTYKDVLSQPAPALRHKDKMLWLQKRRKLGLWVQCDDCNKWRYLADVLDSHELPRKWFCRMNTDKEYATCSVEEARLVVCDEEELIHNEYSAGSLVWAQLQGYPWWPAMVDDDPDTEQFYWLDGFSDIPTYYNVVFFDNDDVTRAWISPDRLKPYTVTKKYTNLKYKKRLEQAMQQANDAGRMDLPARLQKYGFIARYKGSVNSPKKVKRSILEKYSRKLQKKFNIEFPIESTSEEDEADELGDQTEYTSTPKRSKAIKRKALSYKENGNPSDSLLVNAANTEKSSLNVSKETKNGEVPNTEENDEKHETQNIDTAATLVSETEPTLVSETEPIFASGTETSFAPTSSQQQPSEDIRANSPCSDDFDF